MIIKKELCANIVGPLVHLGLEIVHLCHAILGFGMAFRETGDPDPESAAGVVAGLVETADEADQLAGILKGIVAPVVVAPVLRQVAAQGEDGFDPRGGILPQDLLDLLLTVADTGEVRDRRNGGFRENPQDQLVGQDEPPVIETPAGMQ